MPRQCHGKRSRARKLDEVATVHESSATGNEGSRPVF
jgi:hypothetical protein